MTQRSSLARHSTGSLEPTNPIQRNVVTCCRKYVHFVAQLRHLRRQMLPSHLDLSRRTHYRHHLRRPAAASLCHVGQSGRIGRGSGPGPQRIRPGSAHASELLSRLIQRLKPLDRQVIVSCLEGMDAVAIGEITGRCAGAGSGRFREKSIC